MGKHRFKWLVGGVTLSAAVGIALAYLAANHWFGSGDLTAMVAWSVPLAMAVAVLTARLTRSLGAAGTLRYYIVLVPVGALSGWLWALCAAVILGGWIGAFSFPVLFCWVGAGVMGGVTAACLARPQSWPVSVVLVLGLAFGLAQLNADARAPEPRIRVVVKAGATQDEVEQVWTDVLGRRTGRGKEHYLLPSLSSVAASGVEGKSTVLTVSFWKSTRTTERDRVIAEIRRSPLVQRVDIVPLSDSSGVRASVSY